MLHTGTDNIAPEYKNHIMNWMTDKALALVILSYIQVSTSSQII